MARIPLIVAVLLALVAHGAAHEGATGVAKQRMDLMEAMSRETKAMAPLVRDGAAASVILAHAATLRALTDHVAHLFPPGSGGGVTAAAPAIWQRWPAFEAKAADLQRSATALAATSPAAPPDLLRERFSAVTTHCADCHKAFRTRR
jgi:cytochrome c556